jgi:hypothetical protein
MIDLSHKSIFPIPADEKSGWPAAYGLTLRQHYAGLAMQGIVSAEGQDVFYDLEMVATRSVAIADALIAELEKEQADDRD